MSARGVQGGRGGATSIYPFLWALPLPASLTPDRLLGAQDTVEGPGAVGDLGPWAGRRRTSREGTKGRSQDAVGRSQDAARTQPGRSQDAALRWDHERLPTPPGTFPDVPPALEMPPALCLGRLCGYRRGTGLAPPRPPWVPGDRPSPSSDPTCTCALGPPAADRRSGPPVGLGDLLGSRCSTTFLSRPGRALSPCPGGRGRG